MIGTFEIAVIGIVIAACFGVSKLPEWAKAAGRSVGEFKKAKKEMDMEVSALDKDLSTAT